MPDAKNGSSSAFKFSIKKRKLSSFMCKEMLYDYVSGKLDPERQQAVKQFLDQSTEIQGELNAVESALAYCEGLAQTEISEPLLKNIRDAKTPWVKLVSTLHWRQWPDSLKWGVEAVAISSSVVLVALLLGPKIMEMWPKATDQKVILAEVDAKKTATEGATTGDEPPASTEEVVVAEAPPKASAEPPQPSKVEPPPPEPVSVAVAPPVVAPVVTETKAPAAVATPTLSAEKPKPLATTGFLYRAFINLNDVDGVSPNITASLEGLGAEKAGEVPLGWRRPQGAYYHFTLPEENYDKMMEQLRTYGEVRISKDPHPRIMPTGVIRLILWVEDVTLKQ